MTRRRKLLLKAMNNPSGLRFEEFESLIESFGFCSIDNEEAIGSMFETTFASSSMFSRGRTARQRQPKYVTF